MKLHFSKLRLLLLCLLAVIIASSFTEGGETKVSYCDTSNPTVCGFANLKTGTILYSTGNLHEYYEE